MRSSHYFGLPSGNIPRAGVKTVVLFLPKGKRPRALGITNSIQVVRWQDNPLNDNDLSEFLDLAASRPKEKLDVSTSEVAPETWDLTVNNPNKVEEVDSARQQKSSQRLKSWMLKQLKHSGD